MPRARTKNTTVKLEAELQLRVQRAMLVSGATVYNDFARMALIARCREIEDDLRARNPAEYDRIYGRRP